MQRKAILFDLDGTLVDTDRLIQEAYRYMFHKYRRDYVLTKEDLISFLGPTLFEMFPKYFDGDVPTLVREYCTFTHDHQLEFAYRYPYVVEMLQTFKANGIKLGVITSKLKSSAYWTLDCFGLTSFFDIIITLEDVKKPKPDPEGILKALEYLQIEKKHILFVGDNQSDALAGRNAGVEIALVDWAVGRDLRALKPEMVITDYDTFTKEILHENN